MQNARIIARLIYQLFLLSLIVAVLWVKGYLWWVFGIAIVLFVIQVFASLPVGRIRPIDEEDDEDDEEDEDSDDED